MLLAVAVAGPSAFSAAAEERGEQLFALCAQCHGPEGGGNPAALAPAITGLGAWYVERQLYGFQTGLRGKHFDDIPGMRMRPMSMTLKSDEDVKAVAAYVGSLPSVKPEPLLSGGNAERGKQLYATCTACHGAAGEGNEKLNSPSLRHASDWYLLSSLQRYKAGVRGWNPQDTNGALMRSMSNTLVDEQAMKDVIAYITTLAR
jgi:cytochrome c oxidase subunit 2